MIVSRMVVGAALALALALPAAANDSTAELAAGGLVLKKTDHIEMRSEDLYISAKEVRVRYKFANTASQDQKVIVAFPMPDLGGEGFWEGDIGFPTKDPVNILGFRTKVDGVPVKAQVEQKAFVGGKDVTAWLKARGVPVGGLMDGEAVKVLDRLPKADQDEAVRLKLATLEEFDAGKGWERHLAPIWVLRTTYYWEQLFPAGRELLVEHSYKPAVGGTVATMIGSDMSGAAEDMRRYRDSYCVDDSLTAAVRKGRTHSKAKWSNFTEQWIDYILVTGGNWKGPIGDFRLVVDKGEANNLVSFCATGVRKISPTQFEVRKTNWKPDRDLSILILRPVSGE